MPVITLLTDFGLKDPYVGMMKGVILGLCPSARLVDLTHLVRRQDVAEGAYQLARGFSCFPRGTIHLAVVDPGVGGERRAVVVEGDGHYFVVPDNGLMTHCLSRLKRYRAYELTEASYRLRSVSRTFHGRDIFAPAAGHLAAGVKPSAFGPPTERLLELDFAPVEPEGQDFLATVLAVDHFGNLVTNFARPGRWKARVGDRTIPMADSYSEVEKGELLTIWGSDNLLEVSSNQGHAGDLLRLVPGDRIVLQGESEI